MQRQVWRSIFVVVLLSIVSLGAVAAEAATVNKHAKVTIVSMEPDPSLPLDPATVLKVTVDYQIDRFRKNAFFLSPQFEINERRNTSGGAGSQEHEYLLSPKGRATVSCNLGKLQENAEVARPLKLTIFLLEEKGSNSSSAAATSKTMVVLTK